MITGTGSPQHAADPAPTSEGAAFGAPGGLKGDDPAADPYEPVVLAAAALLDGGQEQPRPSFPTGETLPVTDPAGLAGRLMCAFDAASSDGADWIERWTELSPRVSRLLKSIEAQSYTQELAARTMRRMELAIAQRVPPARRMHLGSLLILAVDLDEPLSAIRVPPAVRWITLHVSRGSCFLGTIKMLASGGTLETDQLRRLLDQEGIDTRRLRAATVKAALRSSVARLFAGTKERLRDRPTDKAPDPSSTSPEGSRAVTASSAEPDPDLPAQSGTFGTGYWERLFRTEVPWKYEGDYETLKYRQTLAALPSGRMGRALELACAEGHFTRMLADHVDYLLATDIAPTAVARTARRCADQTNVETRCLDLMTDPLPGGFDLVTCCEVLYYFPDEAALASLAARISEALVPGGHLVMAHAHLTVDEPGVTAFQWDHPFGAKRIGEVFAASEKLALEHEWRSELYRIQRFRRVDPGQQLAVEREAIACAEAPERIRDTVWHEGRPPLRPASSIPVLSFHRIASDGPDSLAQWRMDPDQFDSHLRWLREQDYKALSLAEFRALVWEGAQPRGPSVLITFDDGYVDFLSTALPLLKRHGMTATLFIPALRAGGAADWDAHHGPPARLMDWADLREVQTNGIDLALHGGQHLPMTALDRQGLESDIRAARAAFAEELGFAPRALAYPYGDHDEPTARALLDEGFELAFTVDNRAWSPGDKAMAIPRLEVRGNSDPADFEYLMRTGRQPPS